MIVKRAGVLQVDVAGTATGSGWAFQLDPGEDLQSKITRRRAQLLAILAHVAKANGIDLTAENVTPAPDRILKAWRTQDLEAEREATNTITKARKGTKGRA